MNIGLVGCGRVSEVHMCAYKHIPEVNVFAVSDINLDRAKAFAKEYNIGKVHRNYLDLFEMKNLDYVDICTPIATHAEIVCEAAKCGQNIFVEKPLARSTKECDEIVHEVKKNKTKLCVCHNQIFIPQVMQAKALVDSGRFDLKYFRISVRESAELIGAPSWIMTPEQGGALWETGPHAAYLQLHFLKQISKVCSIGEKMRNPLHDHFIVLLNGPNQTLGVIEISWLARKKEIMFNLIDSRGSQIRIQDYDFSMKLPNRPPKSILQGFYWDQKLVIGKWTKFLLECLHYRHILNCVPQYILIMKYIESIKKDTDPPVTAQDGRKTVHLLECIEESLDKNKPVEVED